MEKATTSQLNKLEELADKLQMTSDSSVAHSLKTHALQILKDIDGESEFYKLLQKSEVASYFDTHKSKILNSLKQAIDYYKQPRISYLHY